MSNQSLEDEVRRDPVVKFILALCAISLLYLLAVAIASPLFL